MSDPIFLHYERVTSEADTILTEEVKEWILALERQGRYASGCVPDDIVIMVCRYDNWRKM